VSYRHLDPSLTLALALTLSMSSSPLVQYI